MRILTSVVEALRDVASIWMFDRALHGNTEPYFEHIKVEATKRKSSVSLISLEP